MNLIIGISGATGVIYGIRLLEVLKETGVSTHLILSEWGAKNIEIETEYSIAQVKSLASFVYENNNLGAKMASGSFPIDGMVIAPCSMKTLSGIAHGYGDSLLGRAADVNLKEGRKLILVIRETPLHLIHLENMVKTAKAGASILPPMPAFYHHPEKIQDIIDQTIGKILDQFGIAHQLFRRWEGI